MPATAIIDRAEFRPAMKLAKAIVPRRNGTPILSHALLRANGDSGMELLVTDLDVMATVRLNSATADAAFDTTLPARALADLDAKAAKGGEYLSIEANGGEGNAALHFGTAAFTLQELPPADFPMLEWSGPVKADFTIPAANLATLLGKTAFAMSTESTRYYLNGVYLHAPQTPGEIGTLRAVGCDGHRLAVATVSLPAAQGMPGVIIPAGTVNILRGLLKGKGVPPQVRVKVNTTKVIFEIGNVTILSKLIDGTFPEYGRVIPSFADKVIHFDPADMVAAISAVSQISSERGRAVKMEVAPGVMALSVTNPDQGTARQEIAIDYDGAPVTIGFNARYVLDILATMDVGAAGLARLAIAGARESALFGVPNSAEFFVLLPMRV